MRCERLRPSARTIAWTMLLAFAGCGEENSTRLRPDTTPPQLVSDLTARGSEEGGITLSWIAPGDDHDRGRATAYDIRIAALSLSAAQWDSASACAAPPAPKAAGERERLWIGGLADSTWYFALRTADDVPNWSGWSNVARAATGDHVAPGRIYDLAAVPSSRTSVSLVWSAPGDDYREGRAAEYDLRYAPDSLTEENWAGAVPVEGLSAPDSAGAEESFTIDGLERGHMYYFGLKTADERHQWSSLSNVAAESTRVYRRLTSLGQASQPSWSPDGRYLACAAATDGATDVFRVHVLRGSAARLTDAPGFDGFPEWSPDGKRIAFVSDRVGGVRRIWVMNADGTDAHSLPCLVPCPVSRCVWSPDGTRIACQVASAQPEASEIWVLRPGHSAGRVIGGDGHAYIDPAWSPDGTQLVVASNRGGSWDLWLLSASGLPEPRSLGIDFNHVSDPTWSPDAQWIVFAAATDLGTCIGRISPIGGPAERLIENGFANGDPAWSPDGRVIAIASDRGGVTEIWTFAP